MAVRVTSHIGSIDYQLTDSWFTSIVLGCLCLFYVIVLMIFVAYIAFVPALPGFCFVFLVLTKRLAGKSISEMTYVCVERGIKLYSYHYSCCLCVGKSTACVCVSRWETLTHRRHALMWHRAQPLQHPHTLVLHTATFTGLTRSQHYLRSLPSAILLYFNSWFSDHPG